ncbi:MAG: thiamine pyrophosphate-dependent enzyme [Burkholderiaceae bacterium]
MGVGLPYAMGVKLAHPMRRLPASPVRARFRCVSRSFPPASSNLPIKVLNLNNRYLGMVRQRQQIEYGSRHCSPMEASADFVVLTKAMSA